MSKIYEALENAERESRALEKAKASLPQTPEATPLHSFVEMEFENEMISLYQNIESRLPDLDKKVLLFLSAKEGEGTSTIVREFARTASKKLGKLVFLLDYGGDLKNNSLFYHITPEKGWEEVGRQSTGTEPADCPADMDIEMTPITPLSNTTPLNVYSPDIVDFWNSLRERYDLILIDSPPAATSPDGIEISRKVDGVVLVVEAEKTRWHVIDSLKEKIANGGGNILGIVFNKRKFYIPDAIYRKL